jgi:hypothetical protein
MPRRAHSPLTPIDGREEIPAFSSEAEEADFWSTHSFGPDLLDEFTAPTDEEAPPARRTRPITVRLDEDVLARIKRLAAQQQKPYQRLMKEMLLVQLAHVERQSQPSLSEEQQAVLDELVRVLRADIARALPSLRA